MLESVPPFAEKSLLVYCWWDLLVGVSVDFQHEHRSVRHKSRASALRKTKNVNTKNPWNELKKTKSHWRAKAALRLLFTPTAVKTDRTQVSPSKLMIPERDRINLMTSFRGRSMLLLDECCL